MTEKRLRQSLIYRGKIISLEKQEVLLPSGRLAEREIVRHPGAVAILAINEEGEVLIEEQYRAALDETIWEIPAGKLEPGESILTCAQRELLEETGYEATQWKHLHSFYTSPGFCDEVVHLFLAESLVKKEAKPEFDEEITTQFFSRERLAALLKPGRTCDGKTLLALYYLIARVGATHASPLLAPGSVS
ncbi:MAG: NUDIX hydrolase [Coprothermobacterota bacterium]|nr:NUDIX hydrolase [Coprothermobacterota bacterium]